MTAFQLGEGEDAWRGPSREHHLGVYTEGRQLPNDQVLDFLFKGPKPGSWPQVEVIVKRFRNDYVSVKPPIPYWNRLSNSTFLHQCTKAVGNLREHTPTAPRMNEGE